MVALATEQIALRAALLSAAGILALAAISGYTARPSRSGPVPGWLFIPVLAGKICMTLGVAGFALIIARSARPLGGPAAMILGGIGFTVAYWSSLVAVQLAQNIVYQWIGAPIQPLRLFPWRKPKRRRKSRGGKRAGDV